jgi:hypothetical protein
MIIDKDTPCFLSEKGYYNFIYPTEECGILCEGCDAERLSWTSGDNSLIALKVPRECVFPVEFNGSPNQHIGSFYSEGTTVVWISR